MKGEKQQDTVQQEPKAPSESGTPGVPVKWILAFLAGLISAFVLMVVRGIFSAASPADALLCACDGFSVSGILFLSVALMMWIAGAGAFDMLGYAVKKGLHHIIPGRFGGDNETFYDYKQKKREKRSSGVIKRTAAVGAADFAIGFILIVVWYSVTGEL